MPLGNLTSQFFANIYLNELDYFVKHKLKAKYYIRYVDDFIILHHSKEQLKEWKKKIEEFLNAELRLELHPQKSKITSLSQGIDFVGFRNFYHFKLLRKRNIRNMERKIIFSLPGNQELTQSLAQKLKIEQGEAEIRSFPDGESYIRIHSEVKNKTAILICTLNHPNAKILPLIFMARTLKELGTKKR